MRILITGGSGLVGSYCVSELASVDYQILSPSLQELDITKAEQVQQYVDMHKPDAILHCAAYTDVTKAEAERNNTSGLVWQINVVATQNLQAICQKNQIYLAHISTDMVFAGRKDNPGPYGENHPRETNYDTLSWYGASKSEAEGIVSSYNFSSIIRISNPIRSHYTIKQDFLHKAKTAIEQKEKPVFFSDQTLTITYIPDVANAVKVIVNQKKQGVFHVSSTNTTSPYEYAKALQKVYGIQPEKAIVTSSLTEFFNSTGQTTRYVQYGGLSVNHTQKVLDIRFSSWQDSLQTIHDEENNLPR